MKNIKEAIEKGADSINQYLNNLMLKDEDITVVKKYLKLIDSPEVLKNKIKQTENLMVKNFISNINNDLNNCQNFVLLKSITEKNANKNIIIDELMKRYSEKKINNSDLLYVIKKSYSLDLLRKMPTEVQRQYKDSQIFISIDNAKDFERFYELQTSGIYEQAITSLDNLEKSFVLWEEKKEKIKEVFNYLDIWMVQILSKNLLKQTNNLEQESKDSLMKKKCIENYIQNHIKKNTLISENNQIFIDRITEQLKDISIKLNLSESLNALSVYENNKKTSQKLKI